MNATTAATAPSTGASAAPGMDALIFQRLHPKAYLERFLAKGYRPDSRQTTDWRDLSFNVGKSFIELGYRV